MPLPKNKRPMVVKGTSYEVSANIKRIDQTRADENIGTHGWQVVTAVGTKFFNDRKYLDQTDPVAAALNAAHKHLAKVYKKPSSIRPKERKTFLGVVLSSGVAVRQMKNKNSTTVYLYGANPTRGVAPKLHRLGFLGEIEASQVLAADKEAAKDRRKYLREHLSGRK